MVYCQTISRSYNKGILSKLVTILIVSMLVYASGCASFAYALEPGWKMVSAPPVSPDEARRILAESAGLVTTGHQLRGMATSETEATPEIQELAMALKCGDPKLIFDSVQRQSNKQT